MQRRGCPPNPTARRQTPTQASRTSRKPGHLNWRGLGWLVTLVLLLLSRRSGISANTDAVSRHRANKYLTSLALVSVRRHGRALNSVKVDIKFHLEYKRHFLHFLLRYIPISLLACFGLPRPGQFCGNQKGCHSGSLLAHHTLSEPSFQRIFIRIES